MEVLSRYTNIRINKLIQYECRVELKDDLRLSRSRVIENITSFQIRYILACNRCQTDINTQIHIPTKKKGQSLQNVCFYNYDIPSSTLYFCGLFLMKVMCNLATFSINTSYFSNHYNWPFMLFRCASTIQIGLVQNIYIGIISSKSNFLSPMIYMQLVN